MNAAPSPTAEWNDEELDRSLRILSDSIRRHLLRQLSANDAATIDELCDELPAGDEVRAALSHVHLPMLADAGIVDVDWERETVRYRSGHRIDALLGQIRAIAEA